MKLGFLFVLLVVACQSSSHDASSRPGSATLRVTKLRTEHLVEPLGIGERAPHFDWRLEALDAQARGLAQRGYRVLVATDSGLLEQDRGNLWDSGEVASSDTTEIEYRGKPLASNQRAFWKVRVVDASGHPSAWSSPATFTTGLFDADDWKGKWIGFDAPLAAKPNESSSFDGAEWIWFAGDESGNAPAGERWFRGHWELPADAKLANARLSISVDNHFELFINGEKIGESNKDIDAWRHGAQFDVGAKLRSGDNLVAVRATNATQGAAGVLAKLEIDGNSWTSDGSWRASDQSSPNWSNPEFDDASWAAARSLGAHGAGPWGRVGVQPLVLPPPRYLRRNFEAGSDVTRATLFVSALGLVQVEIDGRRVGDDFFTPGWTDYDKRALYRTYDVTSLVASGAHAIGVTVADGWYAGYVGYGGRRNHYGDKTRALVQLVLEHEGGKQSVVVSDASWKASTGALEAADFLMGESYDATKELADWSSPGFDDSAWSAVDVSDSIQAKVEAHPGFAVREIRVFEPREMRAVAPDTWVLDLGQNIAGVARLKINGQRGQKIVLRYAERLNPDGTLYTTNLRAARATDTYVCKGGGTETWEPRFTFHGFQYIEVSGLGRQPVHDTVVGVALSSDTPISGSFETSDAMVNRLYLNTLWTQLANFIDVPTDCPQRDERLGWTGDAQVYIRTANFIADAQAFYTKWLVDLVDAQRADGQFPMVAPLKVAEDDGGPAWADAGVVCPWTVYDVYGDRRLLERHYESMRRFVEFCERRSVNLLPPAEFHCFGDWVAINAETPKEVIFEAYFAGSARLLAKSAEALGKHDDAARYAKLYEDVKRAFNGAYVDESGVVKGDTQCAYVLAIAFDLVDGALREKVAQHLVERIAERDWHLSTGFVGTKDLMLALEKIGRNDVAYRLLFNTTFPSWGFTIQNGATSIWERWDGWTPDKGFQDPGMNSFAHYSFGAVTQWMFENIGGIRQDAPGFAKIVLRPEPGGELQWAKVGYDSIRGRIESAWKLDGDALVLEVSVPPNTGATLFVPTTEASSVTESGAPAASARGVKFLRAESDAAVFELQSGRYRFACKKPVLRRLVVAAR
ncbi:MAG: family 78 glycoside hydrolase catalytic domain [Planctomycetota bacterium]